MGNFLFAFKQLFSSKREYKLLLLGLDGAGKVKFVFQTTQPFFNFLFFFEKTTILYKLHFGETVTTIPTIGFNVESIQYKNLTFTMYDVGGQDKIRMLWQHYFRGSDALIFVVDSNDESRIEEGSIEFSKISSSEYLKTCPILVLANKKDLPQAVSVEAIASRFEMWALENPKWHIQECSAKTGEGLFLGFDWLAQSLTTTNSQKK